MLSLKLFLDDLYCTGDGASNQINVSKGWINKFESSQITSSVIRRHGSVLFWIGESDDPQFDQQSVDEDSYRKFDQYAGVAIELEKDEKRVRIARTATGSFPLFLTLQDGIVTSSWKFEVVASAISYPKASIDACRIYLQHGDAAVRQQIIEDMYMLWPGESVVLDTAGLKFREVDPVEVVLPSTFSNEARATDAFIEIISEVIRPNLERSINPLIELSGGKDSACVAVAVSKIRSSIASYGVIHEGVFGEQQVARRTEIIDLLSLNDHSAPSYKSAPFLNLCEDDCQNTIYDDAYRIAFQNALDTEYLQNVDLLITGIGGDELTMTNTYVRQEWEVESRICQSALVASTGRFDVFMRRGIWPIHPLAHPWVVDFCRALPQAIRSKRLLHILTLARAGLSDGFIFPAYRENFGQIILKDSWNVNFDKLFSDSIVADLNIVRVDYLIEQLKKHSPIVPIEVLGKLYSYAKLDAVLKKNLRRAETS